MAAEQAPAACEVRAHADAPALFAACSEVLFSRLALHQICIWQAANEALAVVGPQGSGQPGLPEHVLDDDGVPQVKQLFSFHCAEGQARGAMVLAPGRPGQKELAVSCAGALEEALVAEALAMADPALVDRISFVSGPEQACSAVAAAFLQQRPGRGCRPGLRAVALEQARPADDAQAALPLPAGRMRRVLPPDAGAGLYPVSLCEDSVTADEALLELLTDWHVGFSRDALGQDQAREVSARGIGGLVSKGCLYVWEVDGVGLVACASMGRLLRDVGCSINLVYTPPEHRRHGYAAALVAAMCTALKLLGRRAVLFAHADGQHGAVQLYEKLGFVNQGLQTQLLFPACTEAE